MKTIPGSFLALALWAAPLICQAQSPSIQEKISALQNIETDSLLLRGIYEIATGSRNDYPETQKEYALKGLMLSRDKHHPRFELHFLRELGIYYKKQGELDSAISYYKQSRVISISLNDSVSYHGTGISLANVAKSQGAYDLAVDHFLRAIRYFESREETRTHPTTFMARFNLASVYITIADYPKALRLLHSIRLNEVANKKVRLMRAVYNNLMACYIKTEVLDSALLYGKKAELMAKGAGSTRSLANAYTNLGSILEQQGAWEKAAVYFSKALSHYEALNDRPGMAKSLNNLGNAYTRQGRFDKAAVNLLRAQEILKKTGNIYSLKHSHEMLIAMYARKGEHFNAYLQQQLLMQLKDSILSIEKHQGIQELQTIYETEKKELLLQQANQEKVVAQFNASKNRSRLIQGGALSSLALVSLCFYLVLFKSKKQKQLLSLELNYSRRQLELESDYYGAELKAIKAQMNPHFLFNAMSSVQGLILEDKKEQACTYLARLSGLVRKNLELTSKPYVEAHDELELIETYLNLERMRFGKTFQYEILGAALLSDIQIPALIIQPFLENAIKHGLLHKSGKKSLVLQFDLADTLICTITDNGVGREQARHLKSQLTDRHQSFSTKAIARRFELLQHESATAIGFEITDLTTNGLNTGTQVVLKMPYQSDNHE